MDPSRSQNSNRKNISISILAGIGYAIGGLLVGTTISAIAWYLFFEASTGMCFESCAFSIYAISPITGLVIALIVGIVGGRRIYKRLSTKK